MKPAIQVVHSSGVRGSAANARWIYLGKGIEPYRLARRRLGEEREWSAGDRLRQAAEELRQPFLDFVAEVGALQEDAVTWWSTRFSWKLWTVCDLFLLICYLRVAHSCIEEARQGTFPLVVVVEDPWLLRQIQENLRPLGADVCVENVSLHGQRLGLLLLGAVRRAKWLLIVVRNYLRQRRAWPRSGVPTPTTPRVGIASYPSHSAFEVPGRWCDVYLPGLDRAAAEQGLHVVRLCAPEFSGWERELAQRSSFAYPLILWATWGGLFRSLIAFWRPRWPRSLSLKGQGIRWLCLREWWLEAGRSSLCVYRLHYECLRSMLAIGSWRCLVASYENQPWEKLQVLAARTHGLRSVAVQVNPFSRFWLCYGVGEGERGRMPLPDVIGNSGEAAHRLLAECGTPASSLRLCGTLRYPGFAERLATAHPPAPEYLRRRVLVALPIDAVLTRHLLEALNRAFPNGGREEGLRFRIRPHPMCPVRKGWIRFPADVSSGSFTNLQQDLDSCGTVLFAASTVGFEALAQGKTVLRYRSPRLYDLDENCGPHLPVVSDPDLRAGLLACVREGLTADERESALAEISDFFEPVDPEAMRSLFQLAAGIRAPVESRS